MDQSPRGSPHWQPRATGCFRFYCKIFPGLRCEIVKGVLAVGPSHTYRMLNGDSNWTPDAAKQAMLVLNAHLPDAEALTWSDFETAGHSRLDDLRDSDRGVLRPDNRNVEGFLEGKVFPALRAGPANVTFASRIPPELVYGETRSRAIASRVGPLALQRYVFL